VIILAKYIGVALSAWMLATAAAEGLFRAAGDRPNVDLKGLFAPFADGNYRLAANLDTESTLASGRLTVHTDSLGLRCDEARRFGIKAGDSLDVLLLGDSQGFGNGVNFEESIAGSFAASAAKEGYRVANAGVGGHSAASQMQLAEELRDKHKLKVAHYVLLVTPAMCHGGVHVNRVQVGSDGRLYGDSASALARGRLWIKTHLVIYARIRDAVRNIGIGVEPDKELPFVFSFYERGKKEATLHESFSSYISRFKRFADQGRASVHLVYVPLTLEMEFGAIQQAAATRGLTIDRNVPANVCAAVAMQHGVTFHDLRPVLDAFKKQKKPLHLLADFHYDRELSIACGEDSWDAIRPAISLAKSAGRVGK
jgi:hypothetical protein